MMVDLQSQSVNGIVYLCLMSESYRATSRAASSLRGRISAMGHFTDCSFACISSGGWFTQVNCLPAQAPTRKWSVE